MADRLQTKSARTGTIPEEEQAEEESITVEKYDLICQIMGEHGHRSKRKSRRRSRLNKMAATWGNMRGRPTKSGKKKGGKEGHSEARKAEARAAPCTCKDHRCQPAKSDTAHGSHMYNCEVAYKLHELGTRIDH